jgi:hypothetical protein
MKQAADGPHGGCAKIINAANQVSLRHFVRGALIDGRVWPSLSRLRTTMWFASFFAILILLAVAVVP